MVKICGSVTLYLHECRLFNGKYYFPHDSYILSKDNENFFAIWNAKKQKDAIDSFFERNNKDWAQVFGQDYYNRIPEIVSMYNNAL
jgi:hypothetical protein